MIRCSESSFSFVFLSSQMAVVLVDAYFCLLLFINFTPLACPPPTHTLKIRGNSISFSNVLQVDFLSEQSDLFFCFVLNLQICHVTMFFFLREKKA